MIKAGYIVPGKPQPLLAPEKNEGWGKIRKAFEVAAKEIEEIKPDIIMLYSTQWLSVIGHQIQADPNPQWTHVDQEWHELGSMEYDFKIDTEFAKAYETCAKKRGLHTRTVSYRGFPIDTGSIAALKLLNPQNKFKACIVSCNMYADRAETIVLGKACQDALTQQNKKAVVVAVTGLSHRLFTKEINPKEDRIYSLKDDEWNRKLLQFLSEGRLEDVSQLAREFSHQASGDQKMKAIWWLAAAMGQNNKYDGKVHEYQPIWGTGAAVVQLKPSDKSNIQKEFDEEDVEFFRGSQNVFQTTQESSQPIESNKNTNIIETEKAPKPVGSYPHARRVGNLLYVSGIGPRQPQTNEIPGGPIKDENGKPRNYDIEAQTRAVFENIKTILQASNLSLSDIIDVSVFLIDMDRDFKTFNKVYTEYFKDIQATRTTVSVSALPTPIAVELKVIAQFKGST